MDRRVESTIATDRAKKLEGWGATAQDGRPPAPRILPALNESTMRPGLKRSQTASGSFSSKAIGVRLSSTEGGMDFDKFCAMVRQREPMAKTDALKAVFERLDVDGDGQIYAKDWHKEHLVIDLLEELSHRTERLADLFDSWDKDHNGTLSPTEFTTAIRTLHLRCAQGCSDGDLFDVFTALDVDHSGGLDFHELSSQIHQLLAHDHCGRYLAIKTRLRSSATKPPGAALAPSVVIHNGPDALSQLKEAVTKTKQKVLNLFREWDYDGDGKVSRSEFHRALAHLSFEAPKATIDQLFDLIDTDRSNHIEYKELTKALYVRPLLQERLHKETQTQVTADDLERERQVSSSDGLLIATDDPLMTISSASAR